MSGGRVRVDFNHPYAGKHLVYEVEIVEKIEDPIEKVKAMIELRLPRVDADRVIIEVGEKDVVVDFTQVKDEIDRGTLALGEILLESDLKFLGYESVTFKPNVEELLKPPEVEGETEEAEGADDTESEETGGTQGAVEEVGETEENAESEETEKPEEAEEKPEEKGKKPKEGAKKSTKGRKTRRATTKKTTSKKKTKTAKDSSE